MPTRIAAGNLSNRIVAGAVLFLLYAPALRLHSQTPSGINGTVLNAQGAPAAGAFVRVRGIDTGQTWMVVSQPDGRFSTPAIKPGKYDVQAIGGGFQSDSAPPIEVGAGKLVATTLRLEAEQKIFTPPKKYSAAEFAAMLPEGEGRKLLLSRCVICHSPGNYVSRRKNRKDWGDSVGRMSYYLERNGELQKKFNRKHGATGGPLTASEKETIADYLAKNFGLDKPPLDGPPSSDPNRNIPREYFDLKAANWAAVELNLGRDIQVGAFAFDASGKVWISEKTSGILGRFDTETFEYERAYTPPSQTKNLLFGTVEVDPKGHVWFTSMMIPTSQWFEYDPAAGKVVNTYDVPMPTTLGGDIFFNSIRFDSRGTAWATGTAYHQIIRLDRKSGKATSTPVRYGQHPFGMTVGGDGSAWFAGDEDNALVRIDPKTGRMKYYELPTPDSRPRRIAADAQGNIWANTLEDGRLVRLDPKAGKFDEFFPPTRGAGQGIDIDKQRNVVWFAEYDASRIGRFDVVKNAFTEFPAPTASAQPWMLRLDPKNSKRVWWNNRSGHFGYLEIE